MSTSKEIFGIERKIHGNVEAINFKAINSGYTYVFKWSKDMVDGFNDALNLIDQFELSEEEIEKQIRVAKCNWIYYMKDKKLGDDYVDECTYISNSLKSNQSKIFVRKNEKTS